MDFPIAPGTVPATQAAAAPTVGTPGHFSAGDPASNQLPTFAPAYWFENVTYEHVHVIVGCGLVPDGTKNDQIWTGLSSYFATQTALNALATKEQYDVNLLTLTINQNAQKETTDVNALNALVAAKMSGLGQSLVTSNLTVPANVTKMAVTLRGGGGGGGAGGGSTASQIGSGGGGGGGGWIRVLLGVVPGNNVSWAVGAGGGAGKNNGTSGGQGGDTVLLVSGVEVARASGGQGSINSTQGAVGVGGAGGGYSVASSMPTGVTLLGFVTQTGSGGGAGVYISPQQALGGAGGTSYGKSGTQITGSNTQGVAGDRGCGGGGGTGTSDGGAGGAGEVIYELC